MTRFSLDDLAATIAERAKSGDRESYTAKLVETGPAYCAQKLGEEAVETVIAAVSDNRNALRDEAADLLYHLLVTLHVGQVPLAEVIDELSRRTGQTGLQEKASRSGESTEDSAP